MSNTTSVLAGYYHPANKLINNLVPNFS